MNHTVYRLKRSIEDDRPEIDFEIPENQGGAWTIAGEVVRHERKVDDYVPIEVEISGPRATEYHCYMDGIGPGFFSDDVVKVIQPYANNAISFLPVTLSGARYWMPPIERYLDAFDRRNASRSW